MGSSNTTTEEALVHGESCRQPDHSTGQLKEFQSPELNGMTKTGEIEKDKLEFNWSEEEESLLLRASSVFTTDLVDKPSRLSPKGIMLSSCSDQVTTTDSSLVLVVVA